MARVKWGTAALSLMVGACSVDVDYQGIQFSCELTSECPSGQMCVNQVCRADITDSADASVGSGIDAASVITAADSGVTQEPDADLGLVEVDISGPDTTDDTYLLIDQPDVNFGADATVMVDAEPVKVGLLWFDLSAIPEGAQIASAELELYFPDPIEDGQFVIYECGERWREGEATYNNRGTGLAWATPGGTNAAPDPVATTAPATVGFVEVDLPPALIQSWLDNGKNHGLRWVAVSDLGRGGQFASSESADPNIRPVLSVEYE